MSIHVPLFLDQSGLPLHQRQRPQQQQDQAHARDGRLNHPQHPPRFAHNGQPVAIPSPTQMDRSMTQLHPSPTKSPSTPSIVNSFAPTVPAQDLGDVVQFNQEWTHASQRRSEASQILNDSFDWDGAVLTNQGLPLVDRQRTALGDNNVSMDVCLESFSYLESVDTHLFTDQWSDALSELSGKPSTAQPYLNQDLQATPDGDCGYIASHAPDLREHQRIASFLHQQSLAVEVGLDQMIKSLNSLYLRNTMGLDVSGCGRSMPGCANEYPQTSSNNAGADIIQEHSPGAHDMFMCPYAMRYPDRVNHNCFQRLNTIPYVKQHLRHNHHDAVSCPHQCQKRKAGTIPRRSQPNATLSFGANTCLQINKQRSDRSKTHKQQWARIYQILFPEANRIFNPYIGDLTVKRLRSLFKFMENHGSECLAAVHAQLPPIAISAYPCPEIMYRMAFCTWLLRVFESRFPPQDQQLPGDFLSQIKAVLRGNSAYSSGFAGREDVTPFQCRHQMEQQDPSFTPMSQFGTVSSQQPSYPAISVPYPTQQQSPFQALMGGSLFESQYNPAASHMPYFTTAIQPQTTIFCVTPTPDEKNSEYQFDLQDFLFDQCSPMHDSPSQFSMDPAMDMEGIDVSQLGTGEFEV